MFLYIFPSLHPLPLKGKSALHGELEVLPLGSLPATAHGKRQWQAGQRVAEEEKTFFRWVLIVCFYIVCFPAFLFAQEKPPFYNYASSAWADSILSKISLDEKIGQLFMAAAWSDKDSTHTNSIREQITKFHIGGLIFFQGGPVRQAVLTNEYQQLSKIPLLIGMDAEWGLPCVLTAPFVFPGK